MNKKEFLTIYPTFERLSLVKKTLPTIIEETQKNDAMLIVHDSSVKERDKKWQFLQELNNQNDFLLLLSDNISMAHARNMCLYLGQELCAPDYICLLEDDHGFHPGFIPAMIKAMNKYYGKVSPIGEMRFGLFTGCKIHQWREQHLMKDGHAYLDSEAPPRKLGRANSCCRCAPTAHWNNVLKGYDTDEYLLSVFQTSGINTRNYHKGFTTLIVENGQKMFNIEEDGRGVHRNTDHKLWDGKYTASDPRSSYKG
jgi:hypothetical protein